jgi:hypothetical protein
MVGWSWEADQVNKMLKGQEWARETFGAAELRDKRRSERLVRLAGALADDAGVSPAKASATPADLEGAYRFLRNDAVEADAITEAGCATTARVASTCQTVLAIEDTTTLSYGHAAAEELGDLGGRESSRRRGYFVHSTLAVEAETEATIGLLDQRYWLRQSSQRGQRHERKHRPYESKESFKWQQTAERLRLVFAQEAMQRLISVCDREADVYEYLHNKLGHGERFIVRAARDRALQVESDDPEQRRLFTAMIQAPSYGDVAVQVQQRGGRPARVATVSLRAQRLTLHRSSRVKGLPTAVEVNVVLAHEQKPPKGAEPLTWFLLTTEPISDQMQVLNVLRYYRLRWRIEEFHKAWKSGAGVEERRLQTPDNIHRLAAILAFVAVRLLQLRELAADPASADIECTSILPALHWKLLWLSVDKRKPLPKTTPSVSWAFRALGRLGGWKDTKRTGRVGWEAIWDGWFRLNERLDGHLLARELNS